MSDAAPRAPWLDWAWIVHLLLMALAGVAALASIGLGWHLASLSVVLAILATLTGVGSILAGLAMRRWLTALAATASLLVSTVVLAMSLFAVAQSWDEGSLPCAAVDVGTRHFGLWSEADPIGYGPVSFSLYELEGSKRRRVSGCTVDLSPKKIDPTQRCALVASTDGAFVAFKQSGRYTQLLDVATGTCRYGADVDSSRDAEISRVMPR